MPTLPTVTRATEYEILRGLKTSCRDSVALSRRPLMVYTLLNEALFLENQELIQLRTVMIEDQMHDWSWRDGRFRFFARQGDVADVLIVYATEDAPVKMKFDPMTGAPL